MKLIVVCLLMCFALYVHSNINDPFSKISADLTTYIKTGTKPQSLPAAIKELYAIKNKTHRNNQICATCRYVVDGVIRYRRSGVQKEEMLRLLKDLCMVLTTWGKETCNGYGDIETDSILYIIDNKPDLTPERVCAVYLQYRQCEDPNLKNWTLTIPPKVPLQQRNESSVNGGTQKILHLTDIHVDPLYKPGSNAKCNESLCCQNGEPENPKDAAGYWGDYHVCDMPWHSVYNLMDQIKEHPQIDYVYYTGDIISHKSWTTNIRDNSDTIKALFSLFYKTFNDTPVYPVLGNHESHPTDFYSPVNVTGNISTQWVYDLVAEEWSRWLPEETKETIRLGGYYTHLVKPGFRIIALNGNVCYISNIWLIYEDEDPFGQLQWLVDILYAAEKNEENVHILSHIPPGGTECWKKWMQQFNRIVKRFSKTIRAQLNGHTHIDEIRIFLDESKQKAINVAYNGGSFTTFVGYNPDYRVYDVDAGTFEVTDYEQWTYNLTLANQNKDIPPKWFKLYSFKDAYNVSSMNLDNLYALVNRMKAEEDKNLLKQYFRFEVRDSEPEMTQGCDETCLNKLLCSITSVDFDDAVKCL